MRLPSHTETVAMNVLVPGSFRVCVQLILTTILFSSWQSRGNWGTYTEICIKPHIQKEYRQDPGQSGHFSGLHHTVRPVADDDDEDEEDGDDDSLGKVLCLPYFIYSASATPPAHGLIPVHSRARIGLREAKGFAQGHK